MKLKLIKESNSKAFKRHYCFTNGYYNIIIAELPYTDGDWGSDVLYVNFKPVKDVAQPGIEYLPREHRFYVDVAPVKSCVYLEDIDNYIKNQVEFLLAAKETIEEAKKKMDELQVRHM